MRIPVPKNKLVAFTLAGALLTAIVVGALAAPLEGLTQPKEPTDPTESTASDGSQQVAADAPTPNQDFTPAVQTQFRHEEEEDERYEEDEEEGEEEDEDHEEGE